MKKRILCMVLTAVMAMPLVACGQKEAAKVDGGSEAGYELALITNNGTIDDRSFNQGAWEGVVEYAEKSDVTHKYYKPSEKSAEACATSIDMAIKGGAKVLVCPGFLFETPIFHAQTKNPDTTFIFLDGAPHNGDYNNVIEDNVLSVFYAEEQAGYLAGYAAVTEGYKKLGFMGGIAVPAVIRYGYGYIQGAEAAAKELGVSDVSVKYTYVGNFEASPENMAQAASWYNEGVEVIFSCGGALGNSVMKAAETSGGKVIGVDVDQSAESEAVITSAMKNIGKSVHDTLEKYYAGEFEGGKKVILDAASEGIMLPMDTSKFEKFTQEKYDEIYGSIADGSITVENDEVGEAPTDVSAELVKIEFVQ